MGAAVFIASLVVLAVTLGIKSENARMRQLKAASHRTAAAPVTRDPSEPCDAIPAGHPGFKGSIRYTPYTEDAREPETR